MDNLDLAIDQYEEMILTGDPALDLYEAEEAEQRQKDAPYNKECKHCNVGGLKGLLIDKKWRLYDEYNNLHVCQTYIKEKKKEAKKEARFNKLINSLRDEFGYEATDEQQY